MRHTFCLSDSRRFLLRSEVRRCFRVVFFYTRRSCRLIRSWRICEGYWGWTRDRERDVGFIFSKVSQHLWSELTAISLFCSTWHWYVTSVTTSTNEWRIDCREHMNVYMSHGWLRSFFSANFWNSLALKMSASSRIIRTRSGTSPVLQSHRNA